MQSDGGKVTQMINTLLACQSSTDTRQVKTHPTEEMRIAFTWNMENFAFSTCAHTNIALREPHWHKGDASAAARAVDMLTAQRASVVGDLSHEQCTIIPCGHALPRRLPYNQRGPVGGTATAAGGQRTSMRRHRKQKRGLQPWLSTTDKRIPTPT